MIPTAVGPGPGLTPGAQEAREWAIRELSDRVYTQNQPGLFTRALSWLLRHLQELHLPQGPGAHTGLALLIVALVLVIAAVWWRSGPIRRSSAGAARTVLGDTHLSATEHRARADLAAARSDWAEAVRERFRAVARTLEEQNVLEAMPGRTADELAVAAGHALPEAAAALAEGAQAFDDVCYGGRTATADHDARLRALDRLVRQAIGVPA